MQLPESSPEFLATGLPGLRDPEPARPMRAECTEAPAFPEFGVGRASLKPSTVVLYFVCLYSPGLEDFRGLSKICQGYNRELMCRLSYWHRIVLGAGALCLDGALCLQRFGNGFLHGSAVLLLLLLFGELKGFCQRETFLCTSSQGSRELSVRGRRFSPACNFVTM